MTLELENIIQFLELKSAKLVTVEKLKDTKKQIKTFSFERFVELENLSKTQSIKVFITPTAQAVGNRTIFNLIYS